MTIRGARPGDEDTIVGLVSDLALSIDETSPVSVPYVRIFLAATGAGILLAELDGEVIGLLSYSIRPNLYHAAPVALIEELIVQATARNQGIGKALLTEALRLFQEMGCAEASISTMPENTGAQRLYRSLGLADEAVLLEKHF